MGDLLAGLVVGAPLVGLADGVRVDGAVLDGAGEDGEAVEGAAVDGMAVDGSSEVDDSPPRQQRETVTCASMVSSQWSSRPKKSSTSSPGENVVFAYSADSSVRTGDLTRRLTVRLPSATPAPLWNDATRGQKLLAAARGASHARNTKTQAHRPARGRAEATRTRRRRRWCTRRRKSSPRPAPRGQSWCSPPRRARGAGGHPGSMRVPRCIGGPPFVGAQATARSRAATSRGAATPAGTRTRRRPRSARGSGPGCTTGPLPQAQRATRPQASRAPHRRRR